MRSHVYVDDIPSWNLDRMTRNTIMKAVERVTAIRRSLPQEWFLQIDTHGVWIKNGQMGEISALKYLPVLEPLSLERAVIVVDPSRPLYVNLQLKGRNLAIGAVLNLNCVNRDFKMSWPCPPSSVSSDGTSLSASFPIHLPDVVPVVLEVYVSCREVRSVDCVPLVLVRSEDERQAVLRMLHPSTSSVDLLMHGLRLQASAMSPAQRMAAFNQRLLNNVMKFALPDGIKDVEEPPRDLKIKEEAPPSSKRQRC